MITKQLIDGYISDLILDFLVYNRKEDDDLPIGEIEKAIKNGIITVDEMTEMFKKHLIEGIEE